MKIPRIQSGLHYIGSTHDVLKKKVIGHYKDIWKMVKEEYGKEGFCRDATENGSTIGKFGSSAMHFAKHCRDAKTQEEVRGWCEKNIKVEKWTMVCKTCHGSEIQTGGARPKNSIMSFPVESKFDK